MASDPTLTIKIEDGGTSSTGTSSGSSSSAKSGGSSSGSSGSPKAGMSREEARNKEQGALNKNPNTPKDTGNFAEGMAKRLGFGGHMEAAKGLAGGLQGAAAGAAIAGGILLAVSAATSALQGMTHAVDIVTEGLKGLAGNDLDAAKQVTMGFAEGVGSLVPILGDYVVAQAKFVDSIVSLPEKVSQAFLQQAKALAPYSGQISSAEARSDLKSIQADIREANELGPGLARMVDAEADLKQEMRELLLPIKRVVVSLLADRLEMMKKGFIIIENLPDIIDRVATDLGRAIILAAQGEWTKALESIADINATVGKLLEKTKEKNQGDLYDEFFGDAFAA